MYRGSHSLLALFNELETHHEVGIHVSRMSFCESAGSVEGHSAQPDGVCQDSYFADTVVLCSGEEILDDFSAESLSSMVLAD